MRTVELGTPGPGELTIEVRAAGMNPVDYKRFECRHERVPTGTSGTRSAEHGVMVFRTT
jgi:NADPH:quinone reductase-like Zn-dependent oxidoreductase